MISYYGVIRNLISTSKSKYLLNNNKVVISVERNSNKKIIKAAFKIVFGLSVKKINIINTSRKTKRIGRFKGQTKSIKKAILSLHERINIDTFLHSNNKS